MNRDKTYLIGNEFAKGNKPNKTSFKKGNKPWNKGLKGIHLSPDSQFAKGHVSPKKLEVGTLTKRRTKNGRIRQFIKIGNPSAWEEYAKYLWKQEYGGLRRGDVVHHINGDILDDRLENLIALPRSHHPIFHNRWGLRAFTDEQIDYYKSRYKGQLDFLPGKPRMLREVEG